MEQFVNDNGVDALVHIPDPTGDLWERFDVHQQATYIYIDDDGTVTRSGYGSLLEDVEQLIAT